jgi:alpha-glucosidase (family GH31 glycosyl hydrolase)
MTRASHAGGQLYADTWTSYNSFILNHLLQETPQMVNRRLSGFARRCADAGGFTGSPQQGS